VSFLLQLRLPDGDELRGLDKLRGRLPILCGFTFLLLFGSQPVLANPVGGEVVGGAATMVTTGNTLAISTSDRAIIHWQGFSIAAAETTQFIQPGVNSAVLNRVTSGDASRIMGSLLANGQVYLINPNGIFIGNGALVNVGSFLASTANTTDESFLAGKSMTFSGASEAAIVNQGTIEAQSGHIFLMARTVVNSGTMVAANGEAGLYAGSQFFVRSDSPGSINVQIDPSGVANVRRGQGVDNSGLIEAMRVQLAADGNVYALAVNQRGALRATGVSRDANGTVVLSAPGGLIRNRGTLTSINQDGSGGKLELAGEEVILEASSMVTAAGIGSNREAVGGEISVAAVGDAIVSGRIDATGDEAAGGGRVVVTGKRVGLFEGKVDASGGTGGGEIILGGDYQGMNPKVRNSEAMVMSSDSSIFADATVAGDGGKVILWSEGYTGFYGEISAKGGVESGNGGFVETSSKQNLQAFGLVTASAVNGQGGRWLMDPLNVTISSSASLNVTASPSFSPTGLNANVLNTSINTALNTGTSVTVSTGNPAGAEQGNITVAAPISKTFGPSSPTLTLNANGSITIDASAEISSTAGSLALVLNAGVSNGGDNVVVADSFITGGGTILLPGGSLVLNNRGAGNTRFTGQVGVGTLEVQAAAGASVYFENTLGVTVGSSFAPGAYNISMTGTLNSFLGGAATEFKNTGTLRLGSDGGASSFTFLKGVLATAPSLKTLAGLIESTSAGMDFGVTPTRILGTGLTTVSATTGGQIIMLGDVVLSDGATLKLGIGLDNVFTVGSILGTAGGSTSVLNLNTGISGSVTIQGVVGLDIGTVSIDSPTPTSFNGYVSTTTFLSAVGTGATSYNLAFKGGAEITSATTIRNGGILQLDSGGGGSAPVTTTFAGGLIADGSSILKVGGTLRTSGTMMKLGSGTMGLELLGDTTLSSGLATIQLDGVVSGTGGLNVTAGNILLAQGMTTTAGIVLLSSGSLTVPSVSLDAGTGSLLLQSTDGSVVLGSGSTYAGNAITVATGSGATFVNQAGSNPFVNRGGGRTLVFSPSYSQNKPAQLNGGFTSFGAVFNQPPQIVVTGVGSYSVLNSLPSGNLMAYSAVSLSLAEASLNEILQTDAYLTGIPFQLGGKPLGVARGSVRIGIKNLTVPVPQKPRQVSVPAKRDPNMQDLLEEKPFAETSDLRMDSGIVQ